ncbi:MAG: MotA/TolQ/ExbB proton channel family protein [Gemmataceae bacterium]|nr:MotA/TolQ/ExbB proton channel family protein [Gemmataceae bacterium]
MEVLVNFFTKHAYFAIPMTLMSITGVALVIWRILLNMGARTDMNAFLPQLQQKLEKEGVEGATKLCKAGTGVIPSRLYVAGLESSRQGGLAAMRRSMANVMELEIVPDLNFLLPPILAIAKIATMVGLLGTVISMIGTFTEMQQLKDKKELASQGGEIGLALAATALGLVTAIPLVFAHVLFKAWVVNFETRMKSAAQKLVVLIQAARPTGGRPAAPAPSPPPSETSVRRG